MLETEHRTDREGSFGAGLGRVDSRTGCSPHAPTSRRAGIMMTSRKQRIRIADKSTLTRHTNKNHVIDLLTSAYHLARPTLIHVS